MGRPKGSKGKTPPFKMRVCLKCNAKFASRGPGNRICWLCSEANKGIVDYKVRDPKIEE